MTQTSTSLPPALPLRARSVTGWPNVVTLTRTVAAVALGATAIVMQSMVLLLLAYGCYWVGDVLDGWLARRLDDETRIGAVLDIISDRACSSVLVCGLMVLQPQLWPALALFLLQFMVLDAVLSLAFLHWPLVSPNDFHLVDPLVWAVNWSPPAKAVNTAGVVLAVATGSLLLASTVAATQLLVKVWSARRVLALMDALA